MKKLKHVKYILYVSFLFVLAYALPQLWSMGSSKPLRYPFTYYSSVVKAFCFIDFQQQPSQRKDVLGNVYTKKEFDSIVPMYFFQQLAMDGRLPDSLHGEEISVKKLRKNRFYYRYRPKHIYLPKIELYTLYESFSGNVSLEPPGDFFRLTNTGMEFIDPVTNTVNAAKSMQFSNVLSKLGYQGPALIAAGTPTTRKAYDEGYLVVDQNNQLFHIKMVNGKPFVKKTSLPDGMDVVHISRTEFPDRRFYGFLFDKSNSVYFISTHNYDLVEVPLPAFDYTSDALRITGNMFYWNVSCTSQQGKTIYALDAKTLQVVDSMQYDSEVNKAADFAQYLFPATLKFIAPTHGFIKTKFDFRGLKFLYANVIFLVVFILISKIRKQKISYTTFALVAITGIYGFITSLLINIDRTF